MRAASAQVRSFFLFCLSFMSAAGCGEACCVSTKRPQRAGGAAKWLTAPGLERKCSGERRGDAAGLARLGSARCGVDVSAGVRGLWLRTRSASPLCG